MSTRFDQQLYLPQLRRFQPWRVWISGYAHPNADILPPMPHARRCPVAYLARHELMAHRGCHLRLCAATRMQRTHLAGWVRYHTRCRYASAERVVSSFKRHRPSFEKGQASGSPLRPSPPALSALQITPVMKPPGALSLTASVVALERPMGVLLGQNIHAHAEDAVLERFPWRLWRWPGNGRHGSMTSEVPMEALAMGWHHPVTVCKLCLGDMSLYGAIPPETAPLYVTAFIVAALRKSRPVLPF